MAGENQDLLPEQGDNWVSKTDFLIGMPDDLSELPELRYQSIGGLVFVLQRWPDGSTARGQVPLQELQDRLGPDATVREGWYNALGEFLGDDPGLEA